jgi:hypothetical protein
MEEKIAAVLLFTESLLVNEYGAKDSLWDQDNNVEVEDLTRLFGDLQREGLIPDKFILHLTIKDNNETYYDNDSRFVLFDGMIPLLVVLYNEVIGSKDDYDQGVLKDGFTKIIRRVCELDLQ